MNKTLLSLVALLAPLTVAMAAPADTLVLQHYKALPPVELTQPALTDSVNLRGQQYDDFDRLTGLPRVDLDDALLSDLAAGEDGRVMLEGGRIHTLSASLLSTSYEEATLEVDCRMPYKVSFDGKVLGERSRTLTDAAPDTYSLKVYPSAHRILTIEVEAKEPVDVRLRVIPKRDDHTITLRDDAQEYMSMDFGMTGETISGVSMSPSGRFTIVQSVIISGMERQWQRVLYDGTKRIGRLPSYLSSAGWMPVSEKLYYTERDDRGRHLRTFDPATGETSELCPSIPDGGFTIAPTEDKLIFYHETEGDGQSKLLDRVLSRDDHRQLMGPRNTYDLYLFDLKTLAYRPLTYGYRSVDLQDISRDGKRIIFAVGDNDVTESPFYATAFYEMDLSTMAVDTLFTPTSTLNYVGYTPESDKLLALGNPDAFDGLGRDLPEGMIANTYETEIYLYDRKSGEAKVYTKDFDPAIQSVRLAQDRMVALFSAQDRDCQRIYSLDLKSGTIRQLPASEEYVRSFDVDLDCRKYAYYGDGASNSTRAHLGDVAKGTTQALYDLAAERMKNLRLGTTAEWSYTMPDGGEVPGMYYLPPTFDPEKEYPMLVYYYGGTSPAGRMFDWYYSAAMYAGQDYVVLVLNPSGTTGWGQEYSARHVNAWGDRTADEIIAAVKGFTDSHDFVDAKHIGCFGASYGGFMTQYLLTKTDIFACAISHAGISALSSYWGQGTWGIGYSTVASTNSYPWNNPELYADHSPLFHADKIHTPLLLTHGTSDTNVPFGESVQLYNALKILDRPVELVRVYGEDHHIMELNRRQAWMRTMMAWFQKWLKDDSTWWDSMYPERNY